MDSIQFEVEFLELNDGRQLAYSEFGDRHGKPVFIFHGWPGARLQGVASDSSAKKLGIRVIAPDRPGFGQSDHKADRSILDWPDDIEQIADHLKFRRFAVLGVSGGAPYALACARKIPQRLTAAGVISGIAPADAPGAEEGVSPSLKRILRLSKWAPWMVGILLRRSIRKMAQDPEGTFASLLATLPESDRNTLSRPGIKEIVWVARGDSFQQGPRGHLWEIRLFTRPWGFLRREIRMPIHLWHGEEDTEILLQTAQKQAQAIPNCKTTFLPHEGHYSVYIDHIHEILREIITET